MTELHAAAAHLYHMVSDETFQIRAESPLEVTVRLGEPGAPVLYVLDAAFLLEIASGVVSMLHTLASLVDEPFPRFGLVGVGYPTRDPRELFALRARDLTPSAGDRGQIDVLPPLEFGGAEGFLSTVVEELVPEVEARFEVSTERRGLVGFSFGGLFGLYTLFHRPEIFTDYLLGSPSMWWDGGLPLTWEAEWPTAHDDLPARVFLWAGSEEQAAGDTWKNERMPSAALRQMAQVDRFTQFVDRLTSRRYTSLSLDSAVLDGEYHLTAPAAGLTRGLQYLVEAGSV